MDQNITPTDQNTPPIESALDNTANPKKRQLPAPCRATDSGVVDATAVFEERRQQLSPNQDDDDPAIDNAIESTIARINGTALDHEDDQYEALASRKCKQHRPNFSHRFGDDDDDDDDDDNNFSAHYNKKRGADSDDEGNLLVDLASGAMYKANDQNHPFDVSMTNVGAFGNNNNSGGGLGDDDIDDMNQGMLSNNRSNSDSSEGSGGGDYDKEFMDLIKEFAHMELPRYYSASEKCFMCGVEFKIDDFADHVYKCIRSLDDEEKRQVEDMDAQIAYMMAMEEMDDFDLLGALQHKTGFELEEAQKQAEAERQNKGQMDDTAGGDKVANIAMNITHNPAPRKDELKAKYEAFVANQALVFNQYKFHQKGKKEGECCICGLTMPYDELDQHVLGCLNTSPEYRLGKGKMKQRQPQQQNQQPQQQNNDMDDRTPLPPTTSAQQQQQQQPPTQTQPPAFQFRTTDDDNIDSVDPNPISPFRTQDDDDDDDDAPTAMNTTFTSVGSNDTGGLNSFQIGLMARMVHDRANNSRQADDNSTSLNDLLVQFKAFGFGKDALKRAKDDLFNTNSTTTTTTTGATDSAGDIMDTTEDANNDDDQQQ